MILDPKTIAHEEVAALASKCWNGEPSPCARACPFNLDVRGMIDKTARGRWQAAFKAYRDAVVFPTLVSLLCPAPCESPCTRKALGGSINLREIERTAVRLATDRRASQYALPPRTEKVAIIGAGVAGLSAALCLSQKKYGVTVYEKDDAWGGALRDNEFFDLIDAEFTESFAKSGVIFAYGRHIQSVTELTKFDVVYIAAGNDSLVLTANLFDSSNLWYHGTNIFAGGGLLGHDAMQSIADGKRVTLAIETYLQTGNPSAPQSLDGICDHAPDVSREPSVPRTELTIGVNFTEEETKAEAARCFRCDCTSCMDGCELLSRYRKLPRKIATEVFTDIHANPPFASHTITREAYSCNDCGYCASRCSESVDTGDLLRLSRRTRNVLGHNPPAFHDFWLNEMDFSVSVASYSASGNADNTCKYVFFPGCQLGAYRPDHVLKTYEILRDSYDCGIFLGCCGAPAYWAGDDERLDNNTQSILSTWDSLGKPAFVYACTTCRRMLHELAPEIECVSVYELLAVISVPVNACEYAIFDPCSARDDDSARTAVRTLLSNAGATVRELSEPGKCCGYGGLISVANPVLFDEITANRAAASDLPYVVYCANCNAVFSRRGKPSTHILDIVLGLPQISTHDIDTRRKNSMQVKNEIVRLLTGDNYTIRNNPWDSLEIVIDDELFEKSDRKLISLSDMREAIFTSERDNTRFVNSDGLYQCCLITPALTYWITYKPLGGNSFHVLDAYSHRMRFNAGEDE